MAEQNDEARRPAYSYDELVGMQQTEKEHISAMWGDARHYPGSSAEWDAIMSGSVEDYARSQQYDIQ